GSIRLLNVTTARDEAAAGLLRAHGYALDRHFWHMELDLTATLPAVDPPEGISIRGFRRATDTPAVHEVLQVAFEGHYLYTPTPFVEWVKELDKESFEEDLWLVATESERVVAALSGRRMLGEGWVSELGVLPQWRGRGIGAALLAGIFRIFKDRGFETAVLNVDAANATGATALYERVGMRVRLRWDLYAKTLGS
ncbi:MAG TPA: GNAT family N-acetyltransferase, partial [Actinomycetota bacterium]